LLQGGNKQLAFEFSTMHKRTKDIDHIARVRSIQKEHNAPLITPQIVKVTEQLLYNANVLFSLVLTIDSWKDLAELESVKAQDRQKEKQVRIVNSIQKVRSRIAENGSKLQTTTKAILIKQEGHQNFYKEIRQKEMAKERREVQIEVTKAKQTKLINQ
jgi:hypothetical protein